MNIIAPGHRIRKKNVGKLFFIGGATPYPLLLDKHKYQSYQGFQIRTGQCVKKLEKS